MDQMTMAKPVEGYADQLPHLVREFERKLDDAYAAFGDLAAALPRARRELKLSAVVGHGVLQHFSNAGSAIADARGHSVQGHRLIDKVADAVGFEVVATGDETPKPSDPKRVFTTGVASAAPGDLRID